MAEIHPNDYETPKAKMYAQLLMEDSVLSQCGKLVIKLAQLPQADEDNEDETPNEIELKNLIVEARFVCENMKRKGMLKLKRKGEEKMSRSGGQIAVHCDCCGEVIEIEMTMLASEGGWDTRNINKELENSGWISNQDSEGDDLDFCSDECFNNYKTKNCQKRKRRRR